MDQNIADGAATVNAPVYVDLPGRITGARWTPINPPDVVRSFTVTVREDGSTDINVAGTDVHFRAGHDPRTFVAALLP